MERNKLWTATLMKIRTHKHRYTFYILIFIIQFYKICNVKIVFWFVFEAKFLNGFIVIAIEMVRFQCRENFLQNLC